MRRLLGFAAFFGAAMGLEAASDFEERVEGAIEKGVAYLRAQIEAAPWWD